MKISLIGYGKMGKTIEQIALERNHQIVHRIDVANLSDRKLLTPENTDAVIEFTHPESAYENLRICLEQGVPVVSGSTGWTEKKAEIDALCRQKNGAFFYASNYSIGVNIFFEINQRLARLLNPYTEYEVSMEEIHHTQKKDAPSGTAITLAEGILAEIDRKTHWQLAPKTTDEALQITALRQEDVFGIHQVSYKSAIDTIDIRHEAHSRTGFALGAVLAAEWLKDKKGIFGMKDLLNL